MCLQRFSRYWLTFASKFESIVETSDACWPWNMRKRTSKRRCEQQKKFDSKYRSEFDAHKRRCGGSQSHPHINHRIISFSGSITFRRLYRFAIGYTQSMQCRSLGTIENHFIPKSILSPLDIHTEKNILRNIVATLGFIDKIAPVATNDSTIAVASISTMYLQCAALFTHTFSVCARAL